MRSEDEVEDEGEGEDEGMLGGFFSKKTHRTPNYEVRGIFGGRAISIAQESRMHLGGRVWGASVHMLRYFAASCSCTTPATVDRASWHRSTLLELGAGTGLLGIGMAFAPPPPPPPPPPSSTLRQGERRRPQQLEVRLTDKPDLLPQIEDNIRTNLDQRDLRSHQAEAEDDDGKDEDDEDEEERQGARVVAMELDWTRWDDDDYWSAGGGDEGDGAGYRAAAGVEVVLAADCIYFASLYVPFIETLKRICRVNADVDAAAAEADDGRVVCYLCNDDGRTAQSRSAPADGDGGRWDDEFFRLLAVDFVYERVDADAVLPPDERNADMRMYRVWLKS